MRKHKIDLALFRLHLNQLHAQLIQAEHAIAAREQSLRDEGYVNTIHDCWEREEKA